MAKIRVKSLKAKEVAITEHIDVISILKALEAHIIEGKEMTSTQVNAALALLKKALPDEIPATSDSQTSYEAVLKELESHDPKPDSTKN